MCMGVLMLTRLVQMWYTYVKADASNMITKMPPMVPLIDKNTVYRSCIYQ